MKFYDTKPSLWTLSPKDLPPRGMLRGEPRLSDLRNNPVYRLLVWHRRVAPLRQWLPATSYVWAWAGLFLGAAAAYWRWDWGVATAIVCMGGFVLAFLVPRLVKLRLSSDDRGSSLLGIPDVYLAGLIEAGYPLNGYICAIWADRLMHPGIGSLESAGCLSIPLLLSLVALVEEGMIPGAHLALVLTAFTLGGWLGRRTYRIELALKSAAQQCRRQRPDKRVSLIFAPLGMMNNAATGCLFPLFFMLAMVIQPESPADYFLPPYWIPHAVMGALGWFWGSGNGEAARDEIERNYDALLEVVRGVERDFLEREERRRD